jgi:methyltransferase (TIGR00027 family)
MLARTAFFDNIFLDALNKNIPQIVLFGAGYDTRAYRFASLNNTTKIIELDIATTQNRKKKCLKKAQIDIPKRVTLVPINFNKELLKNVLEKAEYESNEKTLFIWEGVSYYLEPESVDATLEFVNSSSHYESVIAFDYAISISEDNINNYYGVKEFAQTWRKHRSNELFRFAIDEGKIESFLEQRGLKIVNHLDNNEIEKTFLLNENGSLIGQINGSFRFAMASPNSDP